MLQTFIKWLVLKVALPKALLYLREVAVTNDGRLFHNIEGQWVSGITSSSDVKELIPEFYYMFEFLKNKNNLALGIK